MIFDVDKLLNLPEFITEELKRKAYSLIPEKSYNELYDISDDGKKLFLIYSDPEMSGGKVKAVPIKASEGEEVFLYPIPNEEMKTDGLYWKAIEDEEYTLIESGNSFIMPASAVIVKAVFSGTEIIPEAPTFNVISGEIYYAKQTISISCENAVEIWYTLDGSDPSTSDTSIKYTGEFLLNEEGSTTIKAAGYSELGNPGELSECEIIQDLTTAGPVFSLATGTTYESPQNLSITKDESGDPTGVIYYTTDGSDPDDTSNKYTGTFYYITAGTYTYKAVVKEKDRYSDINTCTFTISPEQIPGPIEFLGVSNNETIYKPGRKVYISCNPAAKEIRYTLNGGVPGTSSPLYNISTGIDVYTDSTEPQLWQVRATGYSNWGNPWSQSTEILKINLDFGYKTTYNISSGTYVDSQTVTIGTTRDIPSVIYYTTDGTEPTSSSDVYSDPLVFDDYGSYTIKSKIIDDNGNETQTQTLSFSIIRALKFESSDGSNFESFKISKFGTAPDTSFQYSLDGETWNSVTLGTLFTPNNIYFVRGMNPDGFVNNSNVYNNYTNISSDKNYYCSGNIMHLIDYSQDLTELSINFGGLFRNGKILTSPKLPATTFSGEGGYEYFFEGSSITVPPELPATVLTSYCYCSMFKNCTSLTTAPELPAITLINNCYEYMFSGCTNLITAPELPAYIPKYSCYYEMFYGCSKINRIKCFIMDPSSINFSTDWLSSVSPTGTFIKYEGSVWSRDESGIPTGWTVEEESPIPNYFYIESLGDSNDIKISGPAGSYVNNDVEYSIDFGITWNPYTIRYSNPQVITINQNQRIYFRNKLEIGQPLSISTNSASQISASKNISVGGDLTYLISKNGNVQELSDDYEFAGLFQGCSKLIDAENLLLPSTTLFSNCYYHLFYECSNLVKVCSELPATTLAGYCYGSMFYGCSSLTEAPELPATELTEYCYFDMFNGCTSLTIAPELPATELADYCYYEMFKGCTSLTSSPILPATIMKTRCYSSMFSGCSNLETTPKLPAPVLAQYCYSSMFYGCNKVNYVECMAEEASSSYMSNWLSNVSATGTFVRRYGIEYPSGSSGIPSGWTVQDAGDRPFSIMPLNFIAKTAGSTVMLKKVGSPNTKEYLISTDNEKTWTNYTFGDIITLTNPGDRVFFKATPETSNKSLNSRYDNYYQFVMTGEIYGFGNFDSLLLNSGKVNSLENPYVMHNTFQDCSSLITAPSFSNLTTLSDECFKNLFSGCTKLAAAPDLLSTTLRSTCYNNMFYNCSSLKYIRCLGNQGSSTSYTNNWTYNVGSTGTFIKSSNSTWSSGTSGIPTGWTTINDGEQLESCVGLSILCAEDVPWNATSTKVTFVATMDLGGIERPVLGEARSLEFDPLPSEGTPGRKITITLWYKGQTATTTITQGIPLPEGAVDLGLPSGTLWCNHNVGGTNENGYDYGDYFMWGSVTPDTNKKCSWDTYPFNDGSTSFNQEYFDAHKSEFLDTNNNLKLEYDAARQIMGGNWRMPTKEEWEELIEKTDKIWTIVYGTKDGHFGVKFTSKTNGNSIFIPNAGYRNGENTITSSEYVYARSSTLKDEDHGQSYTFSSGKKLGSYYVSGMSLSIGYPIRGVMKL